VSGSTNVAVYTSTGLPPDITGALPRHVECSCVLFILNKNLCAQKKNQTILVCFLFFSSFATIHRNSCHVIIIIYQKCDVFYCRGLQRLQAGILKIQLEKSLETLGAALCFTWSTKPFHVFSRSIYNLKCHHQLIQIRSKENNLRVVLAQCKLR